MFQLYPATMLNTPLTLPVSGAIAQSKFVFGEGIPTEPNDGLVMQMMHPDKLHAN